MDHCGYIVRVEQLRPHTNADRLQIATFFGNDTIVDLNTHIGDIGVFFPCDLQLSEDFCYVNNLTIKKDKDGKNIGGYLDPNKRVIRAIRLRGERSEGLYLPITCLSHFCKISELTIGTPISIINGIEICGKYLPNQQPRVMNKIVKKAPPKVPFAPTFYEHVETAQLAYNLDKFHNGDYVQLTCKMHGTSGRFAYLPVNIIHKNPLYRLFHHGTNLSHKYEFLVGSRRVCLTNNDRHESFYGTEQFRFEVGRTIEKKLFRGETIYGEIVGYVAPNGAPIMPSAQNKALHDPSFLRMYGPITEYSYGCDKNAPYPSDTSSTRHCCEFYAYRMTMTNEDGQSVEYSPDQLRERCEKMGIKVVPEFERFTIPNDVNPGEYVLRKVEQYFDGPDPIGGTHVREGVVARICNRSDFEVYKHKNFSFKVLTGIAADNAQNTESMSADALAEM